LANRRNSDGFLLANFHRGHKLTNCYTCLRQAGKTRIEQQLLQGNYRLLEYKERSKRGCQM